MISNLLFRTHGDTKIENFTLDEKNNLIEVVYRQTSNIILTSLPPSHNSPDHVWKEIYGVVDGKITLIKTTTGKHIPTQTVPEQIVFPDENTTNYV